MFDSSKTLSVQIQLRLRDFKAKYIKLCIDQYSIYEDEKLCFSYCTEQVGLNAVTDTNVS